MLGMQKKLEAGSILFSSTGGMLTETGNMGSFVSPTSFKFPPVSSILSEPNLKPAGKGL